MYHTPVLLKESIEALRINPDGIYVDLTFGGGGHSREIFSRLKQGRLVAFDCDDDAEANLIDDDRFLFISQNFRYFKNFLKYYKAFPVDGIIADLGVSSHQFDSAERGFSIRFDGPLDLRMDKTLGKTAADIINTYSQNDLIHVFSHYGEIENTKKLVAVILEKRKTEGIKSIPEFKDTITSCIPKNKEFSYLARVFQALRIEVNDELSALRDMLKQSADCLKQGGILVVITYHSLEDRMVKNFFRTGNMEGKPEKDFYGNIICPFNAMNRKPILPSEEEVLRNNRSRSAKMRIAEKK